MTEPSKSTHSNVRCTHVERGIWLVKVPKYLSDQWEVAKAAPEVGRLRVMPGAGPKAKAEILFTSTLDSGQGQASGLSGFGPPGSSQRYSPYGSAPGPGSSRDKSRTVSEATALGGPKAGKGDRAMPKVHKFLVSPVTGQSLAILREDRAEPNPSPILNPGPGGPTPPGGPGGGAGIGPGGGAPKSSLSVEGSIIQRCECRPTGDSTYMKMKMGQIEDFSKPTKAVIQVDRAEIKFKPVARHINHVEAEKERKEGSKLVRLDKNVVQEMVFKAFETHQFYNIKDLCAITQQPYSHLKEILNEICLYNTAPPHRSMWELKPEYRHY